MSQESVAVEDLGPLWEAKGILYMIYIMCIYIILKYFLKEEAYHSDWKHSWDSSNSSPKEIQRNFLWVLFGGMHT